VTRLARAGRAALAAALAAAAFAPARGAEDDAALLALG
jgi:hypothetical protein